MKIHVYFFVFRSLLAAVALLFLEWRMAYLLFYMAVILVLEWLFILQKIYFNSDYLPYRSRGRWLLRIFPALGEWVLLSVTFLPALFMLLILSMAYLDEQVREDLYSLSDYFSGVARSLYGATFVICLLAALSFVAEHIVYLFGQRYKHLIFRKFIRHFLLGNLILLPALVLFTLMLHENEEARQSGGTESEGLLFPGLIWLGKLLIDWMVFHRGYKLPAEEGDELHRVRRETNQTPSQPEDEETQSETQPQVPGNE